MSQPEIPTSPPARRRFTPQSVQIDHRTNRQPSSVMAESEKPPDSMSPTNSVESAGREPGPKPRRRFAPQPVEKTKRQKRSDSIGPIMQPEDKTDVSTINGAAVHHDSTPISHALLGKKRGPLRGHSYTIPPLQAIASLSESDEETSRPPSRSTTHPPCNHSPTSQSDDTTITAPDGSSSSKRNGERSHKPREGHQEQSHDSFEGALAALAAASEKPQYDNVEEMAAAYVNSDIHHSVQHYANHDESLTSRRPSIQRERTLSRHRAPILARDDSFADAAREMQMHAPPGEEEASKTGKRHDHGPFAGNDFNRDLRAVLGGERTASQQRRRENLELKAMLEAARPPMAGKNLEFPRCESPVFQRLQVGFGIKTLPPPPRAKDGKGGLWGGYCIKTQAVKEQEKKQEEEETKSQGLTQGQIEYEFTDEFVTQVYNYLSLGYPCMARPYDEEMAKIAGVPIESLRVGDWDPETGSFDAVGDRVEADGKRGRLRMRGNIGLPEAPEEIERWGENGDIWQSIEKDDRKRKKAEEDRQRRLEAEEQDPRWRALKLYIRYWAGGAGKGCGNMDL